MDFMDSLIQAAQFTDEGVETPRNHPATTGQ